jgi:hypothetical protein
MIGSRRITLKFPVNWLLAICGLAIALIVAYIEKPDWRPFLLFSAAVVGGAAALIAASNALDTRISQIEQTRKAVALDFILRWLGSDFNEAKKTSREVMEYFRQHPGVADQKTYLNADADRFAGATDVLNLFETMSIAIQTGMAEETILFRFFRSYTLGYWHVMEAVIKARRAEKENSRLYQEYEWLFDHWSKA